MIDRAKKLAGRVIHDLWTEMENDVKESKSIETPDLKDLLEKANLIYYLGGSPSLIMKKLELAWMMQSRGEEAEKHRKSPGGSHTLELRKYTFAH